MWTTSASQMVARLTSSTLFGNQNLISILTYDRRTASTSTTDPPASNHEDKQVNIAAKMRGLRARSPYALFVKDNYADLSAKNPDLKLIQISKIMAESWKSLTADKKQTYAKQSQDQKDQYEQEKSRLTPEDLQKVDANEKARRIQNQVKRDMEQLPTKRPRSAYAHFLASLERGEADIKDFMQGAAKRWSQLTVQDKQRFDELHQEEKDRYFKDLMTWAETKQQAATAAATPKKRRTSPAVEKAKSETPKKVRAKSASSKKSLTKETKTTTKKAVSAAKSDKDKEESSSDDEKSPKPRKASRSPSAGKKKSTD